MAVDDLEMLHEWLNEPGVVRWWEGEDVSLDAVKRAYAPDADPFTDHWIAMLEGVDVGWVQCWPVYAFPAETDPWVRHGVAPTAAGIDYLIAAPQDRGQGLGSEMIDTFVTEVIFDAASDFPQVCASPFAANAGSIGALRKAAFTHVADIYYPPAPGGPDDGPCSLMARSRT